MNKELKYVGYAVAAVALIKLIGKQPTVSGIGRRIRREYPKKKHTKIAGSKNDPQLYISTWGKYNSGSLDGAWFNLTDYDNYSEFMQAVRELHNDEDYPEYMIQDYENIPDGIIDNSGYYWITPEDFDRIKEIEELDETERRAYISYLSRTNGSGDIESFRDAFMGEFDSEYDYIDYCIEEGLFSQETILNHIDYQSLWNELEIGDNFYFDGEFIFQL